MVSLIGACEIADFAFTQPFVSGVPPSAAATDEQVRTEKAHRKHTNCSTVDNQIRAESWVHPLGGLRRLAVYPRHDPASLHVSGDCCDQLTSEHTSFV